jgi:hypothetical protein
MKISSSAQQHRAQIIKSFLDHSADLGLLLKQVE